MRLGPVTVVFGLLCGCLGGIPAAAAAPVWNLVETSCTSTNGGCQTPPNLPLIIGSIEGSGTYISSPGSLTESGDLTTNFGNIFHFNSSSSPYCQITPPYPFPYECSVSIDLTDTASGVTGGASLLAPPDGTANFGLSFEGTTFFGAWGSDSFLEGCGFFAQCFISGDLVRAPEPASLPVLLAGLAMMGGALYLKRKNIFADRANRR